MVGNASGNTNTRTTIDQSRQVADKLGYSVGIDPITILTIASTLIPLLIKCWQAFHLTTPATAATTDSKSAELKAFLFDHYDQATKSFDYHLIDQCRPRARHAARQNGQLRLSRSQLDAITIASLERAMIADPSTVCQCFVEAQSMPDDDQIDDDGSNPPVVI